MTVFSDIHIIEYVLILLAVVFMTVAIVLLTYHVVLLYIYAIAISSLYFSKLNIMTTILSVIGVSIGQWLGFTLRILPDKNFRDIHGLVRILQSRSVNRQETIRKREIEKMVRQIDELARTLQTGLASEKKSE